VRARARAKARVRCRHGRAERAMAGGHGGDGGAVGGRGGVGWDVWEEKARWRVVERACSSGRDTASEARQNDCGGSSSRSVNMLGRGDALVAVTCWRLPAGLHADMMEIAGLVAYN
jgi:hypothetical protein